MCTSTTRRSLLFLLVAGFVVSGCVPLSTAQHDRRYPDRRSDRVPARVERVAVDRAVRARIARDADRYAHRLDRVLRLDRRQERAVRAIVADRAYEQVRRTRGRHIEHVYPFPRRAERYATVGWWRGTDRRIERVLDRQQRRIYRRIVRDRYEVRHRDRRGRGYGHDGWYGRDDD